MRKRRSWRWRSTYQTLVDAGPPTAADGHLTAEQRGNLTDVHRLLLNQLRPGPDATWSSRSLWSCLDYLRLGTDAGAEVRVQQAWTDGPDAFCIVYNPPYQPDERVGLRRQIHDMDPEDHEPDVGPGYAGFLSPIAASTGPERELNPAEFGREVAAYDIGEPLGNAYYSLRTDRSGVGWWGALQIELPSQPHA